jgi:hypothetical protein
MADEDAGEELASGCPSWWLRLGSEPWSMVSEDAEWSRAWVGGR